MRRQVLAGLLGVATALTLAVATPAGAGAHTVSRTPRAELTNLDHLDFLTDRVRPPAQPGHTTYRLDQDPAIGVLWVYTDRQGDGSFRRVGGGAYSPATNTWGQGAYDADDIARAAVVYLRQYAAHHDEHSRQQAVALLRGLTYLQTVTGPHAGEVVLWMQPDGTLTPSATPADDPDPSDSGPSYWLARTLWALGEGYADLRGTDPGFAAFLRQRVDLAVTALNRDVLTAYGRYRTVDGARVPAWLIVDGADASSEAVLGLSAYVRAGGTPTARRSLRELAEGIAAMGAGSLTGEAWSRQPAVRSSSAVRSFSAVRWPYGAILPWALSRSDWHAWGAQMPSALAAAATTLGERSLLAPAVRDTGQFTPHLLVASGPDNGLLPTPVDGSQIAYGADARVQSLLAVARATGAPGLRALAGIAAGWFFGQNPSGQPAYDPATGVTVDGIAADGTVNRNSGAESTIHGLLTMQALDADPAVALAARNAGHVIRRDGQRLVEAESAQLSGVATVVRPDSAWTGESQYSGSAFVRVSGEPGTATLRWTLPASASALIVEPVLDRVPGRAGRIAFAAGGEQLGAADFGGGGAQGASPAAGALLPVTLPRTLPAGGTTLTATVRGPGDLDAVLLDPVVSRLVVSAGGDGNRTTLLVNRSAGTRSVTVAGARRFIAYDGSGRIVRAGALRGGATHREARVPVAGGGFTTVFG